MIPKVLHFIVCDRVQTDPQNLHAINIEGLKWSLRSKSDPPFPCRVPFLTILAIFMGGEGQAEFSFRIVEDHSQEILSTSHGPNRIRFTGDPHSAFGMKGYVQNCIFPRAGLYWVEMLLSESVIARQPIRIS